MAPEIAIAASAREWPDRLHRHLLDHGGGRVTTRIMGPDQTRTSSFDVLFIDDICSFLTPRLVTAIKGRGAEVVGVFLSSDGSDAKRRLLECGISDVIETEATPEEFVHKAASTIAHRIVVAESPSVIPDRSLTVGVAGAAQGVGVTELSASLSALIARDASVALVDADPVWPSLAQRLDLPLHPNIRTFLDDNLHRGGHPSGSTQLWEDVTVVGGVADTLVGSPLTRSEFSVVIDGLQRSSDVVVADLGPMDRAISGAFSQLSVLALVGSADPVGVTRLMKCADVLQETVDHQRLALVVNKASAGSYYAAEVKSEIADTHPDLPLVILPFDHKLSQSSWAGSVLRRGPFIRAVNGLARVITETLNDH